MRTQQLDCCVCCFAANGFGQSINASVGGTVADASKALIPGVTVTATNTGTGIANTTVTQRVRRLQLPGLAARHVQNQRAASGLPDSDIHRRSTRRRPTS